MDEGSDFKTDTEVILEHDENVRPVFMDVSAKVQSLDANESGMEETSASSGVEMNIPPASLALVDWEKVYVSLIEYKERKGMDNLVVRPAALKRILEAEPRVYRLVAEESLTKPERAEEWERLQNVVTGILRQYAERLYRRGCERWESNHMVYKTLDETDPNFRFNVSDEQGRYIVGVPRSEQELIKDIEGLIADCQALYESDRDGLPRIYFDRHLYQPLLVENDDKPLKMSPPGTRGERAEIRGAPEEVLGQEAGRRSTRNGGVPAAEPGQGHRRGILRKQWLLPRLHPMDKDGQCTENCVRGAPRHVA